MSRFITSKGTEAMLLELRPTQAQTVDNPSAELVVTDTPAAGLPKRRTHQYAGFFKFVLPVLVERLKRFLKGFRIALVFQSEKTRSIFHFTKVQLSQVSNNSESFEFRFL